MNTKMIRYILCRMLGVEAVLLMIPVIVAALYQEMSGIAFLRGYYCYCFFWQV